MHIYNIDDQDRQWVDESFVVNEETGEVSFLGDRLTAINDNRKNKIIAIAKIIKEQKLFLESIGEAKKDMEKRIKYARNKLSSMQDYMSFCMGDNEKIEDAEVSIKKRKGLESVEVFGEVPDCFSLIKTTSTPNKSMIKVAIKNGNELTFAKLVRKPFVKVL